MALGAAFWDLPTPWVCEVWPLRVPRGTTEPKRATYGFFIFPREHRSPESCRDSLGSCRDSLGSCRDSLESCRDSLESCGDSLGGCLDAKQLGVVRDTAHWQLLGPAVVRYWIEQYCRAVQW
jgi:hypothetical protein